MHPFTKQFLNSYQNNPYALAATGATGVTAAVGLGDLFLGEQNAINSGEFLQNGLVTHFVPAAGYVVGGAMGGFGNAARARMRRSSVSPNTRVVDLVPSNGGSYSSASQQRFRPTEEMNPQALARDVGVGAGLGTVAASIPAVGYMIQDESQPESLGQALSMKDRAELNALLDTHSDGPVF